MSQFNSNLFNARVKCYTIYKIKNNERKKINLIELINLNKIDLAALFFQMNAFRKIWRYTHKDYVEKFSRKMTATEIRNNFSEINYSKSIESMNQLLSNELEINRNEYLVEFYWGQQIIIFLYYVFNISCIICKRWSLGFLALESGCRLFLRYRAQSFVRGYSEDYITTYFEIHWNAFSYFAYVLLQAYSTTTVALYVTWYRNHLGYLRFYILIWSAFI